MRILGALQLVRHLSRGAMKRVAAASCEGMVHPAREQIERVSRAAVWEAESSASFGEAGQGFGNNAAPFQHASAEASLRL
jgi:hypothetical protein